MDPDVIEALEQMHREFCAFMQPFWDEQDRETAELVAIMDEMDAADAALLDGLS